MLYPMFDQWQKNLLEGGATNQRRLQVRVYAARLLLLRLLVREKPKAALRRHRHRR